MKPKQKIALLSADDLIPDMLNANKHTEHGMYLLEKSVRENGLGRSVVVSKDNHVIAGNGTLEVCANIGIKKVRVIETDGSEMVVVKRTDIESGSDEFFKMSLADNTVAKKNIIMDAETIEEIVTDYNVGDWGDEALNAAGVKRNYEKDPNSIIRYVVEVACKNEKEQTKLFNRLNAEGLDCRVVTT